MQKNYFFIIEKNSKIPKAPSSGLIIVRCPGCRERLDLFKVRERQAARPKVYDGQVQLSGLSGDSLLSRIKLMALGLNILLIVCRLKIKHAQLATLSNQQI